MNPILIPFAGAGAVSEAAGTILEKKVLRKHKINFKDYHVFSFLAIILILIPLIGFFWKISPEAFELKNLGIFALIIISSILANLFIFYSIKWEKIINIEPIRLFQPLLVVIFAFLLFQSERQISFKIIVSALIASSALIFSHIKKHHFQFNKYMVAAFFGSLFFALELALSKFVLNYYTPISFYFIRCFFIFIISFIIFRPKLKSIDKKSWLYVFIIGAIWVFYRVFLYFGYLNYGIIFTTLLFILAPVFIYLFAVIFLKEKLSLRNILAALVIIICVLYAISVA